MSDKKNIVEQAWFIIAGCDVGFTSEKVELAKVVIDFSQALEKISWHAAQGGKIEGEIARTVLAKHGVNTEK